MNPLNVASDLVDVKSNQTSDQLIEPTLKLLDELSLRPSAQDPQQQQQQQAQNKSSVDLLGLETEEFTDFLSAKPMPFMPSQLLLNDFNDFGLGASNEIEPKINEVPTNQQSEMNPSKSNSILNLFQRNTVIQPTKPISGTGKSSQKIMQSQTTIPPLPAQSKGSKEKMNKKDKSDWFKVFSELDPLANPDLMERKIGGNSNHNQAA